MNDGPAQRRHCLCVRVAVHVLKMIVHTQGGQTQYQIRSNAHERVQGLRTHAYIYKHASLHAISVYADISWCARCAKHIPNDSPALTAVAFVLPVIEIESCAAYTAGSLVRSLVLLAWPGLATNGKLTRERTRCV